VNADAPGPAPAPDAPNSGRRLSAPEVLEKFGRGESLAGAVLAGIDLCGAHLDGPAQPPDRSALHWIDPVRRQSDGLHP
jgi:hypothetical protein